MAKFQSPLLGYNNNVRHKNRIFHIQTEDSGVNHPHIITHLFMDGGRILKSVKKSYAEHVGTDGMNETVRGMMKEQHKAMFIALRDGQFDELVDGSTVGKVAGAAAGPAAPAPAPAPPRVAAAVAVVAEPAIPAAAAAPAAVVPRPATPAVTVPAAPRPSVPPPVSRTEPRTEREPAPPPISAMESKPRPLAPEARLLLAESDAPDPPTTTRQERAPTSQELTLDFDALDRAHDNPAVPSSAASLFQAGELPPPPKNLFAKELGTGGYRAVEPEGSRRPPAPASAPAKPRPGSGRPNEGRYAPARPAAIFGSAPKPTSAPPTTPTPSIFSDDLISDKSLDEVILSYLAEDLEPPRRK